MSKLKTVSIVIIKIALICFLIAAFNLVMMPKYINENQDGRIVAEMYREKLSPDVLFLGSSTVYSGVSPAVLYYNYGITSYICATSSQTSWNSYYILKEALKRFKPEMVVLDIGFFKVQEDYAEEASNRKAYDYMHVSLNKYEAVKRAMAENESALSYLLPVLRYHSRYSDLTLDDFKYAFYKPSVTYNGSIMNLNTSTELPAPMSMDECEDVRLNSENAKYLQMIISLCRDNDIDLFLMKTPSYQAKWGHGFEEDIADMAGANGLYYVNFDTYTDMMQIDWMNDSPDSGTHLNTYGAEKFSLYLGEILNDYFDITDRRNDEEYSKVWDEKLVEYNNGKLERFGLLQE